MRRNGIERAMLSSNNSLNREEEHNANRSLSYSRAQCTQLPFNTPLHLDCHQTGKIHCTAGYNLFWQTLVHHCNPTTRNYNLDLDLGVDEFVAVRIALG
ncbi:hypothetical protein FJTKL_01301 [Diaporthe vaccinii]|uniref:Uncharacterized protein n=1 Tax=Diaporthe vaccinii TaxID=105482 RepID=A0ABR4E113_9PEZI